MSGGKLTLREIREAAEHHADWRISQMTPELLARLTPELLAEHRLLWQVDYLARQLHKEANRGA